MAWIGLIRAWPAEAAIVAVGGQTEARAVQLITPDPP